MSDIGDRMKDNYEAPARHLLTRRTPVVVRVDGRSFHTYTRRRGCVRPFDWGLHSDMVHAASKLCEDMHGFRAAYVQSDEVSFLLTDYRTLQSQPWFGYVKSKVETASASGFTAAFNRIPDHPTATFDARAFNLPEDEVANYFLWRTRDWERNSVQMMGQSVFSHRELQGKSARDVVAMLEARGYRWSDLDPWKRNGTWVFEEIGSLDRPYFTYSPRQRVNHSFIQTTLGRRMAKRGL